MGLRCETEVQRPGDRCDVDLGDGVYDLIVVIHYLHRPLMPALVRAVAPRGC